MRRNIVGAALDFRGLGEGGGAQRRSHRSPPPAVARRPPAQSDERQSGGGPQHPADEAARGQRTHAQRRETIGDEVERGGDEQQPQCRPQPAPREREGRSNCQSEARLEQPLGPNPRLHQPFGGEFLDDRQDIAADPVAPGAARGDQQAPFEIGGFLRTGREQRAGQRGIVDRQADRAGLNRSPQQGRLEVPVAKHRRSRAKRAAIDQCDPGPAGDRVESLELGVGVIVGDGRDGRLGGVGDARDERHVGRAAVGDEQDQSARFEPRGGFVAVADRNQVDAFVAQPFERGIERGRNALDQHHHRSGSGGGGAARLIFDQGPPGERQERAKPARIILLIGSDQGAERHPHSPLMALAQPAREPASRLAV